MLKKYQQWSAVVLSALWLNACMLPEPVSPNTSAQTTTSKGVAKKGDVYTATVVKVADGDTVTVRDGNGANHKIRLAYIDAPETKQNYGVDSKAALTQMVDGKTVKISVQDIDRYQREVALIEAGGRDVNYRQIELGNAWHYVAYAKTQAAADYQRYQAAMQAAKDKRLGLWQFARPVAPWDYRKQQREKSED